MQLTNYSGQATWHGRKISGNGVPHTYEELSERDGGNTNPPVPPHCQSDDSSVFAKQPNGGK